MIPEPVVQGYKQSDKEYVEYLEKFADDVDKQMLFQCICFFVTIGLFVISGIGFCIYKILTL